MSQRPTQTTIGSVAPALLLALLLAAALAAAQGQAQERGLARVDGAETEGSVAGAVEEPIQVTVRVLARIGRLSRTLEDGDALQSGDLLEFLIGVDRPAYVYVVQRFADGSAAVLHPERGDVQLPAGVETRIPEPGTWFQLDDVVGEEDLYFVASVLPLAEADRVTFAALEAIGFAGRAVALPPPAAPAPPPSAAPPTPPPTPPPSPPATFSLATRGLVKTVDRELGARIETDAAGVAIYHFRIRHEPKKR